VIVTFVSRCINKLQGVGCRLSDSDLIGGARTVRVNVMQT
jgi:hypothetical protein